MQSAQEFTVELDPKELQERAKSVNRNNAAPTPVEKPTEYDQLLIKKQVKALEEGSSQAASEGLFEFSIQYRDSDTGLPLFQRELLKAISRAFKNKHHLLHVTVAYGQDMITISWYESNEK